MISRHSWILAFVPSLLTAVVGANFAITVMLRHSAISSEDMYRQNILEQSISLNRVVVATARFLSIEPSADDQDFAAWTEGLRTVLGHADVPADVDAAVLDAVLKDDPLLLRSRIPELEAEYRARIEGLRALYDRTTERDTGTARELWLASRIACHDLLRLLAMRSVVLSELEAVYFTRIRKDHQGTTHGLQVAVATVSITLVLAGGGLLLAIHSQVRRVQTLEGLIPICAHCKNVRRDDGYWQQVEQYVSARSRATFSHGLCPDCLKKHYPEVAAADAGGET